MNYIPIIIMLMFLSSCSISCEDCIKVCNKSVEWGGVAKDKTTDLIVENVQMWYNESKNKINECCYPSDCPQAVNNPYQCTCIYMIECLNESEIQ